MSNTKKVKLTKAQEAQRQERRGNLLLALKTLVSNDACVRASREWKGFKGHGVPIIIALISVILALIPSLVSRLNVNAGATFLGTPNYSYNIGLSDFTQKMNANGVHIKIENQKIVTEGNLNTVFNYPATEEEKGAEGNPNMQWYHVTTERFENKKTVFEAFINNKADLDDLTFFKNIAGTTDASQTPDGKYRANKISWSYIAIGKESIVFAEYNQITGAVYAYITGIYDRLEGYDLISSEYPSSDLKGMDFENAMSKKWINTINQSYQTQKLYSTFQYLGILEAIYTGLIILFGFLIWIMTRGKNNPLRVYTIWQCQRMSYWASFTPAVLSIPVGFFLSSSSLGMFGFIFIFGMRLMWMSMKALRPVQ